MGARLEPLLHVRTGAYAGIPVAVLCSSDDEPEGGEMRGQVTLANIAYNFDRLVFRERRRAMG